MALVISDRDPLELVVLATAIDEDALKEQDARDDLLILDPEDVPAVRPRRHPTKRSLAASTGGCAPGSALDRRPDAALQPLAADSRGNLVPDLYTRDPETGRGAAPPEAPTCEGLSLRRYSRGRPPRRRRLPFGDGGPRDRWRSRPDRAVCCPGGCRPRQDDACMVLAWLENQGSGGCGRPRRRGQRLAHPRPHSPWPWTCGRRQRRGGGPGPPRLRRPVGVEARGRGLGAPLSRQRWGAVSRVSPDGQVYALREAPDGHDLVSLSGVRRLGCSRTRSDPCRPGVDAGSGRRLPWTTCRRSPRARPQHRVPTAWDARGAARRWLQLLLGPTREIEVGAGAVVTDRVGRSSWCCSPAGQTRRSGFRHSPGSAQPGRSGPCGSTHGSKPGGSTKTRRWPAVAARCGGRTQAVLRWLWGAHSRSLLGGGPQTSRLSRAQHRRGPGWSRGRRAFAPRWAPPAGVGPRRRSGVAGRPEPGPRC